MPESKYEQARVGARTTQELVETPAGRHLTPEGRKAPVLDAPQTVPPLSPKLLSNQPRPTLDPQHHQMKRP